MGGVGSGGLEAVRRPIEGRYQVSPAEERPLTSSAPLSSPTPPTKEWHGDGATVVNLLGGVERRIDADALIVATPNVPETTLADTLLENDREVHAIGDCVAPRWASMAIYAGRKPGLEFRMAFVGAVSARDIPGSK